METKEDILFALKTAGFDLSFCCGTIKGICFTDLYLNPVGSENTVMQDYTFLISEQDYKDYGISEEDTFDVTPTNSTRQYTFKVDSFLFDMTGWVNLYCNYVGVCNV